MSSLRGITEIIGVRAVIIDVRQYLSDGRQIENINQRIAASTVALATASTKATEITKKLKDSQLAASNAVLAEQQASIKKQAAIAAASANIIPKPSPLTDANNKPINSADIEQATAAQASLDAEVKKTTADYAAMSVVANRAAREAIADASLQSRALDQETRARERLALLQKQKADATRSQRNALTTGVALVGTAAIAVTAGASIKAAADYQQSLSKINVLTNATDEETKQLGATFLKLSTQIPVSAADLAQAAYVALSSGIKDTVEALTLVTQASKAAVAGQGDVEDITRAVITVLNGYPKAATNAIDVTDTLFAAVREGSAEFNDFAGSLGKVIPIAAALGVPFDQLAASMALLTNGGLSAEEAATALRAVLNDLAKDENSKQAQQALAEIGQTVEGLRASIKDKGLPQAMADLIDSFRGNLAAIEPIIPNIRGLVGALDLARDHGKTAAGILNSLDTAGGIVNQSFAKTKDNVSNLAKTLQNELNVALIQIGSAVLPVVTQQLQALIGWVDQNKDAIAKFVSEGLNFLLKVISDIASGFNELQTALSNIVGPAHSSEVALAAIGIALAWALPGGPYLKGLALALTLIGEISKTGVDTPIGHFGGRSRVDELKKEQQDLQNTLKEINNPSGPGGVKGFLNDIAGKLSDTFGTPGATNIGTTGKPEVNQAAKEATEKDLAHVTDLLAEEEKKQADAAKLVDEVSKPLTNITYPALATNTDAVSHAAKDAADAAQKLAEEQKKLAEGFQKSSEAAGQVEELIQTFKKFGAITPDIASGFNLSAAQAGQVQGADAVAQALNRSAAEAFNYVETIATITQAWQQNAAVGKELAQELSQATLEASQKALGDVFSRPVSEVANLNVDLAKQQGVTANLNRENNPGIFDLKQQLAAIDKQISQTNRINTLNNRAAERAQRAAEAAKKAQDKAAQDQIDALQKADLEAQIAAERQLAALQKLIDVNTKSSADLQEAFLKSNNDLQQQINKAVGQGDTAGALKLVDQQKAATKAYEGQQTALTKSNQQLAAQQKAAQEAEAERQRQAKLAEANAQASKKATDSTDSLSSSLDDAKAAQDDQTTALDNSKQAIQDQIDALQKPIDASVQQEKVIQDQIAVYEAGTAILKAQGVAADKTLLSYQQQYDAAHYFTAQIGYASGQAQILSKSFYDFIPGAKAANTAIGLLQGVMDTLNGKITGVINPAYDAEAERLYLQKTATEDLTTALNTAATKTVQTATDTASQVQKIISQAVTGEEQILADAQRNLDTTIHAQGTGPALPPGGHVTIPHLPGFDIGGFTGGNALIAQLHPHEVVLPLNNPSRTSELLTQIPPSITAALAKKGGNAIFAPNISVSGETLDTMEATAIRAVQRAFRDARITSGRSGGLVTQGLGPNY